MNNIQLLPLKEAGMFETLVCEIFNLTDETKSYDTYGRKGQSQSGIDIISYKNKTVIQCKHKLLERSDKKNRDELKNDINEDIIRFLEYNKANNNHFTRFILASTYKQDTSIQTEAIRLSNLHNLQIEYWSWERLTRNIDDEKFLNKYYGHLTNEIKLYYRNADVAEREIFVDKNLPLFYKIYEYLFKRFEDITVLPSKFFLNSYVFQGGHVPSRRDVHSFKTSDPDFFKVFEHLEFKDGYLVNNFTEESDFQKANFIVRKLRDNHINAIYGKKYNEFKLIENKISNTGPTLLLDEFKYLDALKVPFNVQPGLKSQKLLELGYFFYKLGDLIAAKAYFVHAVKSAKNDKKNLSVLIAQHNLFHLGKFIRNRYWKLPNNHETFKDIDSISLKNIYVEDIEESVKELIVTRSFFVDAADNIQSYTNKVTENYHTYIRGGNVAYSFEEEIGYEYATLSSFLLKNSIIFDEYSDYADVVHNVFNSMLASYSMKTISGRIKYFEESYLLHFIEFGEYSVLEKYFKRYDIYDMEYIRNIESNYDFIRQIQNFSNNSSEEINHYLEHRDEHFQEYFKNNHRKIFNNFLLFSGRFKLDDGCVNIVIDSIFKIVANKGLFNEYDLDNIIQFFILKKNQIKNEYFNALIFLTFDNSKHYLPNLFLNLMEHLRYSQIQLSFSENEFNLLISFLKQDENESLNKLVRDFFVVIYPSMPNSYQMLTKELLIAYLDEDVSSDFYYTLCIYDIIDYNYNDYFTKSINSLSIEIEKMQLQDRRLLPNAKPQRNSSLDQFFNICFKFDIVLDDVKFNHIKGYSNYYDWLLDIDNFDYSKFDPNWTNEYSTIFYLKKIRKHSVLKNEFEKHMFELKDNKLQKLYFKVFVDPLNN